MGFPASSRYAKSETAIDVSLIGKPDVNDEQHPLQRGSNNLLKVREKNGALQAVEGAKFSDGAGQDIAHSFYPTLCSPGIGP